MAYAQTNFFSALLIGKYIEDQGQYKSTRPIAAAAAVPQTYINAAPLILKAHAQRLRRRLLIIYDRWNDVRFLLFVIVSVGIQVPAIAQVTVKTHGQPGRRAGKCFVGTVNMLQGAADIKFAHHQVNPGSRIEIKTVIKYGVVSARYRSGYIADARIQLIIENQFAPVDGPVGNTRLQAKRQHKPFRPHAIRISSRNVVGVKVG